VPEEPRGNFSSRFPTPSNKRDERERERERETRFNNVNPSFPLDRCRTVSRRDNPPYRGIVFSITAGLLHRWVTRNHRVIIESRHRRFPLFHSRENAMLDRAIRDNERNQVYLRGDPSILRSVSWTVTWRRRILFREPSSEERTQRMHREVADFARGFSQDFAIQNCEPSTPTRSRSRSRRSRFASFLFINSRGRLAPLRIRIRMCRDRSNVSW